MHYILDGHEPQPVDDLLEWGMWFEAADRRVAFDRVGAREISTVFLGLDHAFPGDPPVLFETMVFPLDSAADEFCERYGTWDEAEAGHERIVAELRVAIRN